MIKLSVLYPKTDSTTFDMDYYCNNHMQMVKEKLGPACKRIAVEEGLAGGGPGDPPAYVAMGHMYFDKVEDFQTAFAPHAESILSDIPNYTNAEPVVQISTVHI